MNTTNLFTCSNVQLVDQVRALQQDTGKVMSAASTLLRLKKPTLIEMIEELSAEAPGNPGPMEPACDSAEPSTEPSNPVHPEAENRFVGPAGSTTVLTSAEIADMQQAIDEEGIDPPEMDEPAPQPATPARKRVGAAPTVADTMVITVLAPSNPRRPGTAGHKRFALLQTGNTVGHYVEAVKLATHNSDRYARGTLNKAIRLGHVRVDAPAE
jgi:hypothetical protein